MFSNNLVRCLIFLAFIASAFAQVPMTGGGKSTPGGEDPLTTAWVAAVVGDGGTVSTPRRTLVNTYVVCLRTAGLVAILDRDWLFAAENSQSAQYDLMTATAGTFGGSGLTFTPNRGYAGDGVGWFDTGFNPGTAGGHYTLDLAHIGLWAVTAGTSPGGRLQYHGWLNAGINRGGYIATHEAALNVVKGNINGAFNNVITANVAAKHGVINRSANNAVQLYVDGSSAQTGSTASDSLTGSVNIWFGARNLGGSENQGSDEQMASAHIGGSLSSTNVSDLWTCKRTYMTAVGVP